jgi:hypothetical protein
VIRQRSTIITKNVVSLDGANIALLRAGWYSQSAFACLSIEDYDSAEERLLTGLRFTGSAWPSASRDNLYVAEAKSVGYWFNNVSTLSIRARAFFPRQRTQPYSLSQVRRLEIACAPIVGGKAISLYDLRPRNRRPVDENGGIQWADASLKTLVATRCFIRLALVYLTVRHVRKVFFAAWRAVMDAERLPFTVGEATTAHSLLAFCYGLQGKHAKANLHFGAAILAENRLVDPIGRSGLLSWYVCSYPHFYCML